MVVRHRFVAGDLREPFGVTEASTRNRDQHFGRRAFGRVATAALRAAIRSLLHNSAIASTIALALSFSVSTLAAANAIDVFDRENLRFGWAPADGPVDGYVVFVSTNGAAPVPRAYVSSGTEVTIDSKYGQTIAVSVAASGVLNGSVASGPHSDQSTTYRFVQSPVVSAPPADVQPGVRYDFDGDGRADILIAKPNGSFRFWTMNGLDRLSNQLWFNGGGISAAAVGDFNGDALEDVIWRGAAGALSAFVGSGRVNLEPDPGFEIASAGDYNGDGISDLLFRNPVTLELQAWFLDGLAIRRVVSVSNPLTSLLGGGAGWALRGSGDFDGDGIDDLIWVHAFGLLAIGFVGGGGIEEIVLTAVLPSGGEIAAIGDLDGDGRSDLTIRQNDTLIVRLMDGATVAQQASIGSFAWSVVGSRDLNGDGRDDLVLAGPDWQVGGVLMNGVTILDQGTIETTGSGAVVVQTR